MRCLTILLSFLFLLSCATSSKETIFESSESKIVVKICSNTSRKELNHIKKKLLDKHRIVFDFSKTSFNSENKVDNLYFIVKGPEGYKGQVEADLYMTDEYQGFIRDYSKHAKVPFRCGAIQ